MMRHYVRMLFSLLLIVSAALALVFTVQSNLFSSSLALADDEETALTAEENAEAVLRAIQDGIVDANIEVLHELYSADYVGHLAPSSDRGTITLTDLTELVDLFSAAITGLEINTHHIVADGNVVATRSTVTGTFEFEFYDTPPTGEPVEFDVQVFHLFNDEGQIVEEWFAYDSQWVAQQLGELAQE